MTDQIIIQVKDLENSRKQTIFHIETLIKSAQNSIKKKDYAIDDSKKFPNKKRIDE